MIHDTIYRYINENQLYNIALIISRDLGTNRLRTLHKTTFKGMRSLTELDMFDNNVEYLPAGLFDSLVNLRILLVYKYF